MSKQPGRRKHVPQRTCVACRSGQAKGTMVRIVRTPEGAVVVDETGKRNGRGAYLCPQRECWETALTRRQLEHALRATLTAETKAQLLAYAAGFPQRLSGEFAGDGEPADVGGEENE